MIPESYAEWMSCFEAMKEGTDDRRVLEEMEKGTFEWSAGAGERLVRHFGELLDFRIKEIGRLLQRDLNRSSDETETARALLSARKRLALAERLASLPAFPENVRESYTKMVADYAQSADQSLERSARSDLTGRMRALVKKHALIKYKNTEPLFRRSSDAEEGQKSPVFHKRRNVMLP